MYTFMHLLWFPYWELCVSKLGRTHANTLKCSCGLNFSLHTDHGVAPPVQEDVGGGGGAGGEHTLLAGRAHGGVVAMEPGAVACVEDVRHVVTLGGLPTAVLKEF